VNCSTAAQYFHVLRRQARWPMLRPLVVMTPKSLLRLPAASSSLDDLAAGRFQTVIDDADAAQRGPSARSLVMCTGKLYHDLIDEAERRGTDRRPIVRLEQLYPFPDHELRDVLQQYGAVTEVIWAQEEPKNMGAWTYVEPRLRTLLPDGVQVRYVGRPERASPAEGYPAAHKTEQARIIAEALG
jgi:2-oxoglutarate dehydrogenase E1 component